MKRIPELDRTEIPVVNPSQDLIPELHGHTLAASRIKAPGGWVVVCSTLLTSDQWKGEHEYTLNSLSTSAVFVADPEHRWLGDEEPEGE